MERWDILDIYRNKTGKTIERGQQLGEGEYHLIVDVWIMNSKNEFLISKRSPAKEPFPNLWEPTMGGVIAGEDSLSTALREVEEEMGIVLDPSKGKIIKRVLLHPYHTYADVWLFKQEINIEIVVTQKEEITDVIWATKDVILDMIDKSIFLSKSRVSYLDDLK